MSSQVSTSGRGYGFHFPHVLASVSLLFLLMLITGCASTQVDPLNAQTARTTLNAKELALWDTADKIENLIAANVEPVEEHEETEEYLHDVLTRLTPGFDNPEMRVRIHLLGDPSPNAFMLPNGGMYVNTGLLALLDNEAQVATILGHEFCHFRNRHSYRERIKEKNEMIKGALLGGVLGALAADTDAMRSISELWRVSSVSGYSRDLELEADQASLGMMVEAGYEPAEAIRAFERLQSVSEPEEQGSRRFATHPKIEDRIASYRRCLKENQTPLSTADSGVSDEAYMRKVFNVVVYNAELNLEEGNFDVAGENLARCLRHDPACARAHFLQGELRRCGPGDGVDSWQAAADSYREAIECDPNFAPSYCEAGLLLRRLGKADDARNLLGRYLELVPDAADAPIVRWRLTEMDDPNWAPSEPYRAVSVDETNFAEKVQRIGLIPIACAVEASDIEERKEQFEAALRDKLEEAGYEVVPSSAFSEVFESIKARMGPLFDPNTGQRLEEKYDALLDHAERQYRDLYRVDAMAYSAVALVSASWSTNIAAWHGVQEPSTGRDGFWANLTAPSAYGTIPALSFRLVIADLHDEICFGAYGGIQLCSRVTAGGFTDVPAYEILADLEKNARSVEIACQDLPRRMP